jgi:hypothetical protein
MIAGHRAATSASDGLAGRQPQTNYVIHLVRGTSLLGYSPMGCKELPSYRDDVGAVVARIPSPG